MLQQNVPVSNKVVWLSLSIFEMLAISEAQVLRMKPLDFHPLVRTLFYLLR